MHKLNYKLLFPFFVISILYLLTLRGLSGNLHPNGTGAEAIQSHKPPFETSMERGRYAQVVSLAESKNYDVNEFHTFLKPDLAWYNDRFMSTFPPGVATLSLPFYLLGRLFGLAQVFTFVTSLLFSILTAYLVYLTCKKLGASKNSGIFAALVFTLGSVTWAYSVSFSAHPVSAFISILGAYLLIDILKGDKNVSKNILLIGVLTGLNFVIDYPNVLIFTPIAAVAFCYRLIKINNEEKDFVIEQNFLKKLPMVFGFIATLALFVVFNLNYFQKPIAFTNTYTIKFLEVEGINIDDIKLTNKIFENRDYGNRFSLAQTISGVNTLLLSKDRGLLQYSPVYLLAIPGFILLFKKHKIWASVGLSSFVLNVLVYGSYDDPWGGWAFGPRYLIVTLPFLAIFCGEAFDYLTARFGIFAQIPIFLLLLFSSGIALLGAVTTNGVPPSIEVANLGIHSNYLYNWEYLTKNGVSSFFYSLLPTGAIKPKFYFFGLLVLVGLFQAYIIFFRKESIQD